MLFSTFLLLATGAAAWTVPAGQPNGVYSVSTDSSGVSVHTLIKLITDINAPTKPTTRSAKFYPKRQLNTGSNDIGCGGYALSNSDNAAAAGALENQCGNGAFVTSNENGRDVYSIVGGSVVYYCNYSGTTNNCYASEAVDAFARITSQCGENNAGWDQVPARNDQYGYEGTKNKFCGRGLNGKV